MLAFVRLRVLAVASVLAALAAAPADAATCTVSPGSVAQLTTCLAAASDGDTITLAPGFYALTESLTVDASVTIQGDPLSATTIDGGGNSIFNVNGTSVTIQNLTLQNAETAIQHESSGSLFVSGVTITTSSTGIYPGDSDGDTIVTNTTFSGNQTGILISCSLFDLRNVTIAGNDVGINFDFPCGEQMQIANSLIVGNTTADCGGGGGFTPIGDASFDSDGSCVAMGFGPGLTTRNPLLGPLANNGGPTLTEALPPGSPAINAGDNAKCPATDQRGFARNDGACDLGAYEFGASAGGGNTATGSNVEIAPAPGVTITFGTVTVAGNTTATAVAVTPPSGFQVDGVAYDISTTAVWQPGTAIVCLPYNQTTDPTPHIFHYAGGTPVDVTASFANGIVCSTPLASLSPFAVLAPMDIAAQLAQLQELIDSFNLRKRVELRFTFRLDIARFVWSWKHRHNVRAFCAEMQDFVREVRRSTGRTLTAAEASQLLQLATQIETEAGC